MPSGTSDNEPRRSGRGRRRAYAYTAEQLYQLAYEAAGVGSGAVMAEAPDVVMPTEVITEGLHQVLAVERGIPAPEGYR